MTRSILLAATAALVLSTVGAPAIAGADADHKAQQAAGHGYQGQKDKWGMPVGPGGYDGFEGGSHDFWGQFFGGSGNDNDRSSGPATGQAAKGNQAGDGMTGGDGLY